MLRTTFIRSVIKKVGKSYQKIKLTRHQFNNMTFNEIHNSLQSGGLREAQPGEAFSALTAGLLPLLLSYAHGRR
jgi:hypothetical protein